MTLCSAGDFTLLSRETSGAKGLLREEANCWITESCSRAKVDRWASIPLDEPVDAGVLVEGRSM